MKYIWPVIGLLTFSACSDNSATATPAKPAYDESWYISPGWPGEYPNGFTVLKEGVVLAGRMAMNKQLAKSLQCPVPHKANYNQWNHERVKADKLEFVAAAKTFPVTIKQGINVPAVAGEKDVTLSFKAGETLTYLTYIAEGFALMQYQDVEYQINEGDLGDQASFGEGRKIIDDLWVNIPCADGQRGWILYAELQGRDGIGETEHMEYGVSGDLTD